VTVIRTNVIRTNAIKTNKTFLLIYSQALSNIKEHYAIKDISDKDKYIPSRRREYQIKNYATVKFYL
jgi:hypothetical protein